MKLIWALVVALLVSGCGTLDNGRFVLVEDQRTIRKTLLDTRTGETWVMYPGHAQDAPTGDAQAIRKPGYLRSWVPQTPRVR